MMAIAAWMVWKQEGVNGARIALGAFLVQLLLNVAWSGLFFGLRRPLLGLVDIVFLWIAILVTMVLFFRREVVAGVLLIPYLLWVSFAAFLNFRLWQLNR
jgi:tryptophan-rich sensory protein